VSPNTFWLGRAAAGLAVSAVVGCYCFLFGTQDAPGRRLLVEHERVLTRKLRFLRAAITARQILALQAGAAGALIIAAALSGRVTLLLGVLLVLLLPGIRLERSLAARATQVEAQIEPWLNAVANSLRASPSLGEAISASVALVPPPMSQEVDVLVKEYELGTPLDRALGNLSERVPSKTLAGTTLALKVARRSGGNLPEMLESAAIALRELARLEGVVRTKTAEGKAQAFVIGAIPIPLVGLIQYSDPHFFEPLLVSFTGNLVIAAAGVLWALAILVARKILQVDV
jgi:tight adherence protein B